MATETMRAARILKQDEKYTLVDVPKPTPGPGQVVIAIKAAGFCHTDILTSKNFFDTAFPITGSHEAAGVVSAVGPGVTNVVAGDRVIALNQVHYCGTCYDCTHLDAAFCPFSQLGGLHVDGCFSDYFLALAVNTVRIPDGLAWDQAAPLTCAGVTIYNAIVKAGLEAGGVLGISGVGALGHIGVQIAKAMGLFVVGIDARDEPLELCRSFKHAPDVLINARETSAEDAKVVVAEALVKAGHTQERLLGLDAIIVTAESDAAITYALDMVRRHGLAIMLSQPKEFKIPFKTLIFKDVTVKGHLQGGPDTLKECADFVAKHGIEIRTTKWKGLESVNDLWEHQESPGLVGKNVVVLE